MKIEIQNHPFMAAESHQLHDPKIIAELTNENKTSREKSKALFFPVEKLLLN